MRMTEKDVVWETMAGIESIPSSWEYDLRVSRILGDGEHTPRSIHRAILDLAAVRLRNAAPCRTRRDRASKRSRTDGSAKDRCAESPFEEDWMCESYRNESCMM